MESHSRDSEFSSEVDHQEFEEKITMFLADEETAKTNPLNTRIHNPYQYVYRSDSYSCVLAAKLCLSSYVKKQPKIINHLTDNKKFTDNEDIQIIITKILLFEALLQVVIINLRHHETMKFKDEVDPETLEKFKSDTLLQELEESENFKTKEQLENHLTNISEKFGYISKEILTSWMTGTEFICISAVYCVTQALKRTLSMANLPSDCVKDRENNDKKIFISLAHRIACLFDYLYAACLDDPSDILYQNDPESEDLKLLLDCCSFSMVENLQEHLENDKKRMIDKQEQIAIALRSFKHKSSVGQAFSSFSWSFYYKIKKQKASDNVTFLASIFDKDELIKVFHLIQSSFMEKPESKKDLPKCEVKRTITIPFCQDDILRIDNLLSEDRPEMIKNEFDLPFIKSSDRIDLSTHMKIRVNCEYNWSRVNWKKARLADPDSDCIHYDGVILYIHGGGFIAGSSEFSQFYTINYAKETGYPVFSLDYRLAPEHKFPCALNDCWQAYLWIVKYAKKYLKITYDKIILMGDSVGGNLCIGVTALSIIKHCKIPDGLNLIYPILSFSKVSFAPSALLTLDDLMLSCVFLNTCGDFYAGNDLKKDPPFLLSVNKLPDKTLRRFPPCRFVLAGQDPCRDECLRFILRLRKQQVDVKCTEFTDLINGFIGSERDSYPILESKKAIGVIIEYLQYLSKEDDDY
ncbi:unnamed protein product [Moneuplotes crassus]|uniref:Alpha/beta hydrolase fold-3 domain-containing protein n=1 Tax=Euplotes crassus TaxID=5936 RepID=A0AAD1U0Y9_EUPCR|nr:unnamed protein product [Moneuplotes crassus]